MAKSESAHKYTTAQVLNPLRKPNHFLGTLLISAWTKTRSSNNMASNDAKNKRTKPIYLHLVVDAPSGIGLEPKAPLNFAAPSSNWNPMILSLLRHSRKAPSTGSTSPSQLPIFNREPKHHTPCLAHDTKGTGPRAQRLKAGHLRAPGAVPHIRLTRIWDRLRPTRQ